MRQKKCIKRGCIKEIQSTTVTKVCARQGKTAWDTFVCTEARVWDRGFVVPFFEEFVCAISSHRASAPISLSFVAAWEVLNVAVIQREEFSYIPDFCMEGRGCVWEKGFSHKKASLWMRKLKCWPTWERFQVWKRGIFAGCVRETGWVHGAHLFWFVRLSSR